jgi:hypothetical protein
MLLGACQRSRGGQQAATDWCVSGKMGWRVQQEVLGSAVGAGYGPHELLEEDRRRAPGCEGV